MAKNRILVVEDNLDNMTLIVDVLLSLDYEVLQATDGEQGVHMATEEVPDVILMDLHMPIMDGYDATTRILEDCQNYNDNILTEFCE